LFASNAFFKAARHTCEVQFVAAVEALKAALCAISVDVDCPRSLILYVYYSDSVRRRVFFFSRLFGTWSFFILFFSRAEEKSVTQLSANTRELLVPI
jgi:hypothetical protein